MDNYEIQAALTEIVNAVERMATCKANGLTLIGASNIMAQIQLMRRASVKIDETIGRGY